MDVTMGEVQRMVEFRVAFWVHEDVDIERVVKEMEYTFSHPAIREIEIVDIFTEG
jgi:phenylalanyl-tRNA synthetase beta subunit